MAKKIQIQEDSPSYFTWDNSIDQIEVLGKTNESYLENNKRPYKASTRYRDVEPNVSVLDGFTRADYNWFRSDEANSTTIKQIMASCMRAHYKFSFVRNVTELMADFGSKGIRLVHKNKKLERVFQHWFKKVGGPERSERFLNYLYRCGNVAVVRNTGKLKPSTVKKMERIQASIDFNNQFNLMNKEIPTGYKFLNPLTLDVIGDELALSVGDVRYGLNINKNLASRISNPKNQTDIDLVNALPESLVVNIKNKKTFIPIDPNTIRVFHYKKDDWCTWAYPITSSILDDLVMLEKMKLADLSALDGATSHIRLWKLGSLEHKILPGPGLISDFRDMLLSRAPGTVLDIFWNPAIELQESQSTLHNFLGEDKYKPTLASIFAGLGVPSTLVAGGDNGFTNNFISMKTFIERLHYGRELLCRFWEEEIRLFQESMGYRTPAKIMFDYMSLSDENAEKAIWIQLFDRNIVSLESIRERFSLISDIEQYRVKREQRMINRGSLPAKAGPFTDSQPDLSLTKIYAQNGEITPSEAGLELEDRKPGELSRIELNQKMSENGREINTDNTKDIPGKGRPLNSRDSGPRKQRVPKPRTSLKASTDFFVDNFIWAKQAYLDVKNICQNLYEQMKGSDNISISQDDIDKVSFTVLCNLENNVVPNMDMVLQKLNNGLENIDFCDHLYDKCIKDEISGDKAKTRDDYIGFIYSLYKSELINTGD